MLKHSSKIFYKKISKNINQFLDIAEYIVQILCKLENKLRNTFLSWLIQSLKIKSRLKNLREFVFIFIFLVFISRWWCSEVVKK